ncbi:unnamed protein product [Adineta steineri]|uniref:Uncharacterized protein n=1 Tax=Adineta steineri TaxID=433720 RepID=A0A814H1M0_9BILA|nr:unnamed protein product [Adineta steineri]CAF1391136.1 unnamed protein product [Adineta steineri]CAF1392534.1 unnamed protein product [Adineta steineri]
MATSDTLSNERFPDVNSVPISTDISPPTSLNFNLLIREPSRNFEIENGHAAMAANERFLVYFAKQILVVIDRNGNERLKLNKFIDPYDICWSSYLNKFLILGKIGRYGLDLEVGVEDIQTTESDNGFGRCITCYDKTCLIVYQKSLIEEYELPTWLLKKTFSPPQSWKATQTISRIRFTSNGSHVGVVISEGSLDRHFSFELRRPNDMAVLQTVQMGTDFSAIAWLLALPNEEFLVNTVIKKKFYLIDSNGQLKEEIDYDNNGRLIVSTTLINERCLVVKTENPWELRFYDL